jgi:hypothetical protein
MDVCPDALDQQVFDAMTAAGMQLLIQSQSVLQPRSMSVVETYVLPSDRAALLNGECLALEPLYSRGIFRPIPRSARVTRVEAMFLELGTGLPLANGELRPVLRRSPYAAAYAPAEDIVLRQADRGVGDALQSAQTRLLLNSTSSLMVEGRRVAYDEFTCAFGDKAPAPCYLAEDRYVALHYVGTAPFPPDARMQLEVLYEMPRTAEEFER